MKRLCRASLVLSLGVFLGACGSSTPTAPRTSATSSGGTTKVLTIAGTTILGPGQTSQLTARNSDGTQATGVTWTSLAPAVATVTADGLATGVAAGTVLIRASAPGALGSVTLQVLGSFGSAILLSSCGAITAPGNYVVVTDLPAPSPCFTIANVAAVHVDCQNHAMLALVVDAAQSVTIENCVVNANVKVTNSSSVTVRHSTIAHGLLWAVHSTDVLFDSNTVNGAGSNVGSLIAFEEGSGNRAVNNVLDGAYDGGPAEQGVDDGIVLMNETGDAIENNTIRNVFDAGIEGVDAVLDTSLTANVMSNLGEAGVASYWCTQWTGNTVQQNTVTQAPLLAFFLYDTGPLCGATIAPEAFDDNRFVGNVFGSMALGRFALATARILITLPGRAANNLIQGNNLGSYSGPFDPRVSDFDCSLGPGAPAARRASAHQEWNLQVPRR